MKRAILLMFIFLAGCGTISRTVSKAYDSFFNDETVSSEDKKEVLLETTRMQEAYKQFRMYHYCAIGLGAFGIASVAFRVTSTRIGLGCIAGAVGLSAWATYAPANQGKIGYALGGLVLSMAVYILKKLVIDKLIEKKQAPKIVIPGQSSDASKQ